MPLKTLINKNKNWFASFCPALLLILLLNLMFSHNMAGAQNLNGGNAEPIHLSHDSRLWLEGVTNINNYSCAADTMSGFGKLEDVEKPQDSIERHGKVSINVEIPVYELDCGKRAMNNDMFEALQAKKHPRIMYSLEEAQFIDYAQDENNDEWMNIYTKGVITVAGVDKNIEVNILGRVLDNNRFHVKGEKELDMTEFGVSPPKALLGLIKAKENITIKFDVIVSLDEMNL